MAAEDSKPDGMTASEKYLGKICKTSFLNLWSYQNVFTDRGVTKTNRQGKELCDLLVVFDEHIVIFSDKSCAMPNTGNTWLDWKRWYKKAIRNSADQIFGAERWLRKFPDRIYLDSQCEKRFPLNLPQGEIKIHRVVVALGAGERVEKHYGGNSRGSLILNTYLKGDECLDKETAKHPFCFGRIDPTKGYVHVLDDVTLDIVLNELDTVTDFIRYLEEKEQFLSSETIVTCAGEEELLGYYLANSDEDGKLIAEIPKDSDGKEFGALHIAEGIWDDYQSGPKAEFMGELRAAGRFIDGLIEHFTSFILTETMAYGGQDINVHERNLRFFAAEPRSHRAMMGHLIAQKVMTTPRNVQSGVVFPSSKPEVMYVFLLFPPSFGQSLSSYREERQGCLTAYCMVTKHLNPHVRYVVGLATQPKKALGESTAKTRPDYESEDIMSFDFQNWTEEEDRIAAKLREEEAILQDIRMQHVLDPISPRRAILKGNRHERRKQKARRRKEKFT